MIELVGLAVLGLLIVWGSMSSESRVTLRKRLRSISFRQRVRAPVEPTERIVMDSNAGYRGSVHVVAVPKEGKSIVLWTIALLLIAIASGVLVFR